MEIDQLAQQLISFITPFLAKGGEEIIKGAGKDLWEKIKKTFTSEKDQKVLKDYIDNPTDQKSQGKMELKISDKLEDDKEFLKEIIELMNKNPDLSIIGTMVINQNHSGSGDNIGRDKIQN